MGQDNIQTSTLQASKIVIGKVVVVIARRLRVYCSYTINLNRHDWDDVAVCHYRSVLFCCVSQLFILVMHHV